MLSSPAFHAVLSDLAIERPRNRRSPNSSPPIASRSAAAMDFPLLPFASPSCWARGSSAFTTTRASAHSSRFNSHTRTPHMAKHQKLTAQTRTGIGRSAVNAIKKQGLIPAVVMAVETPGRFRQRPRDQHSARAPPASTSSSTTAGAGSRRAHPGSAADLIRGTVLHVDFTKAVKKAARGDSSKRWANQRRQELWRHSRMPCIAETNACRRICLRSSAWMSRR